VPWVAVEDGEGDTELDDVDDPLVRPADWILDGLEKDLQRKYFERMRKMPKGAEEEDVVNKRGNARQDWNKILNGAHFGRMRKSSDISYYDKIRKAMMQRNNFGRMRKSGIGDLERVLMRDHFGRMRRSGKVPSKSGRVLLSSHFGRMRRQPEIGGGGEVTIEAGAQAPKRLARVLQGAHFGRM